MYDLYLKNFRMMNEYFIGYMENMRTLNESLLQSSRKTNEESGELGKSNENVASYYISYSELCQKMSKQWMDAILGPFFRGAQAQENKL
jgi:hypothetical protein